MVDTESIGLAIPLIDDRSEELIYRQSQNVVAARSNNALNDFSDSGPLGVLLRAQAFAGAELLYRANQLPLALAVKLLELTGVRRRLGSKAVVNLTFSLTAPRSTPFVVPKGFEVVDGSGERTFITEEILTIPAGSGLGAVSAIAEEPGEGYNLPAYTINQLTQPLTFLASVVNLDSAQGGASAESIESAIDRGLVALRARNPVSANDFELEAEAVMGAGSKAKSIGLLGPDRLTEQPGASHLFLLSATGEPANIAVQTQVRTALSGRLMLGSALYISPMELVAVQGGIIARLLEGFEPEVVADALWKAYQNYLAPAAYNPGEALLIQELGHNLRFTAGLDFLDELSLNDELQNIPMPNAYTLPQAFSLNIKLTDTDGNLFEFLRGSGEAPDFNPPI